MNILFQSDRAQVGLKDQTGSVGQIFYGKSSLEPILPGFLLPVFRSLLIADDGTAIEGQFIMKDNLTVIEPVAAVLQAGGCPDAVGFYDPGFFMGIDEIGVSQRTGLGSVNGGIDRAVEIDATLPDLIQGAGFRTVGRPETVIQRQGHHARLSVEYRPENPRIVGALIGGLIRRSVTLKEKQEKKEQEKIRARFHYFLYLS